MSLAHQLPLFPLEEQLLLPLLFFPLAFALLVLLETGAVEMAKVATVRSRS